MDHLFLFGEFVSSNNFLTLLTEKFNILSPRLGLGIYFQGIPIQNTVDFVWGTSAGIRTLPTLTYLTIFQEFLGVYSHILYLLAVLFLPFFSFVYAIKKYDKINSLTLLAGLFYAFNPWIIDRLFSGFWQLNIAYALLPFLIIFPLIEIKKGGKQLLLTSAKLSLISSVILYFQPHFLIMVSLYWILYLINIIYKKNYEKITLLIKLFAVFCLLFFLTNVFFLIPGLFFKEQLFTASGQYFSIASVGLNGEGASIENLLKFDPLLYKEKLPDFDFEQFAKYFFIFTLISVFIFKNKRREWILIFSFLIILFLAKGINEPLSNLSVFLYNNFVLLHFFRDPARFTAGMALFASLVIAFHATSINRKIRYIYFALGIFAIILSNWSFITKSRYDLYRPTTIPAKYISAQAFLNKQPPDTRLLTIPDAPGISNYPMYTGNPTPTSRNIFDMALPLNLELVNGTGYPDSYSNQIISFLSNQFTKGDHEPQILAPLAAKLVLIDNSLKNTATPHIDPSKIIFKKEDISIFETDFSNGKISTKEPIFAIGDFATLEKIYKLGNKAPVVLINQGLNSKKDFNKLGINTVFTDLPNSEETLVYERLSDVYSLEILKAAWNYDQSFSNCEPNKMNHVLQKGNLFTSGECVESGYNVGSTKIPISIPKDKYIVAIKAMSENTAPLKIDIGSKNIDTNIDTKGKLQWITLGNYDLDSENVVLNVENKEKIVIDYLVIIPIDVFNKEKSEISRSINSLPLEKIKIDNTNGDINFKQSVDSISLSEPVKYLTYRFTYGKFWKSDKPSEVFISDGYAMTFVADSTIGKIWYYPNFIYKISLILSAVSSILIIIFIFFKEKSLENLWSLYKKLLKRK